MVFLPASLCNCRSCVGAALFWRNFNPLLQVLFKDMPPPEYNISAETVRVICSMAPRGTIDKLLARYFRDPKIPQDELLQYQRVPTHYLISENGCLQTVPYRGTVGADGQAIRASYFKGERSRHKVLSCNTLFRCFGSRLVLDYRLLDNKNQEPGMTMEMLENIELNPDDIFIADAMNNTAEICSCLCKRKIDYILPLKTNNGWKPLHDAVENLFLDSLKKRGSLKFRKILIKHGHGRKEKYEYIMLRVPQVSEGTRLPEGVHSVILVIHHSFRHIKGTLPKESEIRPDWRYYFSSLKVGTKNFAQARHTIGQRWMYEEHHNMLDTVMMQDRINIRNKNHMDFRCGINKIVYNVMSYIRQRMSRLNGMTTRPISFMSAFNTCAQKQLMGISGFLDYLQDALVAA